MITPDECRHCGGDHDGPCELAPVGPKTLHVTPTELDILADALCDWIDNQHDDMEYDVDRVELVTIAKRLAVKLTETV